jgi:polyhydroxyalkanoate synthesis regulator phasin
MAKKQQGSEQQSPVGEVQAAVIGQLEEARKRIVAFEKELVKRGRAQQRELEVLIRDLRAGKPVKQLEKQASAASHEVKKRLDGLQDQVLGALGVASKHEISQLNRELAKLSKKVDALVSRKAPATPN